MWTSGSYWKTKTWVNSHSQNFYDSRKKVKASVLAIVSGIILSLIIIGATGTDPFSFLGTSVAKAFTTGNAGILPFTMQDVAWLMVGGTALAIGFRAKIINIAIVGQLMFSGLIFAMIGVSVTNATGGLTVNRPGILIATFLVGIGVSTVIGGVIGFLKVYFKINEVVSSIMLNWALFYIGKWFIVTHPNFYDSNSTATKAVSHDFSLAVGNNTWIVPFVLAIVICLCAYLLLRYSRFGLKLNALGSNSQASRVNNVAVKQTLMSVFLITGAVAGMFAYIYYLGKGYGNQVSYNMLSLDGFNTIAIALIAYNNPLAIVVVSFLFGVLTSGMTVTAPFPQFQLALQVPYLIFGILIYAAAIAMIFLKFDPWMWYVHHKAFRRQPQFVEQYVRLTKLIKEDKLRHKEAKTTWKAKKDAFDQTWKAKHADYRKQYGATWKQVWVKDNLQAQKELSKTTEALVYADLVITYKKDRRFLKKTAWETYLKNQKGCDVITYKQNNFVMHARALDKLQLALAKAKTDAYNKSVNNKKTYMHKIFRLQAEICGSQQAWKDKYETCKTTLKQQHARKRKWTAWWTNLVLRIVLYQNLAFLLYKIKRAQQLAKVAFAPNTELSKQQQVQRWLYKVWFYPLQVDNFDFATLEKHFTAQAKQKEILWRRWVQTRQGAVVQKQEQRLVKKMVRWTNRFLKDNKLFLDQKAELVTKYVVGSKKYYADLKAEYQTKQKTACQQLDTDLKKWRALFQAQKKVLKISHKYATQLEAKRGSTNVR